MPDGLHAPADMARASVCRLLIAALRSCRSWDIARQLLNRLGRPRVEVLDGYLPNPHPHRTAVGSRIVLPVEQHCGAVGLAFRDRCADPSEVERQRATFGSNGCRVQDEMPGVLFNLVVCTFPDPERLMIHSFVLRPPPWISAGLDRMPSVPGGAVLCSPSPLHTALGHPLTCTSGTSCDGLTAATVLGLALTRLDQSIIHADRIDAAIGAAQEGELVNHQAY